MPKKKGGRGKKLEERLVKKQEPVWTKLTDKEKKDVQKFSAVYKEFLGTAKTERESVFWILKFAERNGFKNVEKVKSTKPGDKIYFLNRNKNIALVVIGKDKLVEGLNIIASHVDAPRLDLKQTPLYEDDDTNLALFKSHYYGGIKKYQWVNQPLAIHGKVIKADGSEVVINIGENPDDPMFMIADLLPHLYHESQAKRKLPEGIKAEEMNIIVGSLPIKDNEVKKKVKLWVLNHLNEKYGMVEEDFTTAELEIVPAGKPRDVGFDRSMIGAYGHDDRICAYTSMKAICELRNPKRTAMALFFDKEEIGSEGNTSARSRFLESVVATLIQFQKSNYTYGDLRKGITNSKALSSDVTGAVNPTFKDVHELTNAPKLGYGVVLTKYTGRGGKYASSDANVEFIGEIRRLFNRKGVHWQTGELGKVDEGGGGTVAKFLAEQGLEIVDCGPSVLSLHAPYEIASKVDLYVTYKAYNAFYTL